MTTASDITAFLAVCWGAVAMQQIPLPKTQCAGVARMLSKSCSRVRWGTRMHLVQTNLKKGKIQHNRQVMPSCDTKKYDKVANWQATKMNKKIKFRCWEALLGEDGSSPKVVSTNGAGCMSARTLFMEDFTHEEQRPAGSDPRRN
ncbi:hypothetical protein NDU88_003891 [Pleurodeles waltl]|uniref:Uncharacterized protein n=1 Tax=Pleurodeles waltl TaxID=8319 RepID=A0AAV7VIE0_PLEWA|nr:hypothetical protein NDU88_003891 [Pleurodeles waltl]